LNMTLGLRVIHEVAAYNLVKIICFPYFSKWFLLLVRPHLLYSVLCGDFNSGDSSSSSDGIKVMTLPCSILLGSPTGARILESESSSSSSSDQNISWNTQSDDLSFHKQGKVNIKCI